MRIRSTILAVLAATTAATTLAGPTISGTHDANALAGAIAGSDIVVSGATFSTSGPDTLPFAAGIFTDGVPSIGFASGIVLTSGHIFCASGENTEEDCGLGRSDGDPDVTTLAFDFTTTAGVIEFQYVFGSEEYNEFVDQGFNDVIELLVNGVNVALLPGAAGEVSIDNVNCNANSAFYRNNSDTDRCPSLNLPIQYDGLTTVLTASAPVRAGVNTFELRVRDQGDNILDSGVFIKAGSFSGGGVGLPEPAGILLTGLGIAGLALLRRRGAPGAAGDVRR